MGEQMAGIRTRVPAICSPMMGILLTLQIISEFYPPGTV